MTDSELDTVLNEVIKQMLGEISALEIKSEKDRISEEKRKMEEARYVNAFDSSFVFGRVR